MNLACVFLFFVFFFTTNTIFLLLTLFFFQSIWHKIGNYGASTVDPDSKTNKATKKVTLSYQREQMLLRLWNIPLWILSPSAESSTIVRDAREGWGAKCAIEDVKWTPFAWTELISQETETSINPISTKYQRSIRPPLTNATHRTVSGSATTPTHRRRFLWASSWVIGLR